jgi:hypothetical protein
MIDYKNTETLDKAIRAFVLQCNKSTLKGKLHELLVACALHAVHVNSADRLTNLYNQLDDAWNKRNGVLVWIEMATDYRFKKDKAGNHKFLANEKSHVFRSEYAEKPFWTIKKVVEANSHPLDILKSLQIILRRADKAVKEGTLVAGQEVYVKMLHDVAKGFPLTAAKPVAANDNATMQ